MIRDQVEDGGISFAASTVIAYASDEMVSYVVKSNPVGFVKKSTLPPFPATLSPPQAFMVKRMDTTLHTGRSMG